MPAEPVAVTDVISELNTNWNASNVTTVSYTHLTLPTTPNV